VCTRTWGWGARSTTCWKGKWTVTYGGRTDADAEVVEGFGSNQGRVAGGECGRFRKTELGGELQLLQAREQAHVTREGVNHNAVRTR